MGRNALRHPEVGGSNPSPAITIPPFILKMDNYKDYGLTVFEDVVYDFINPEKRRKGEEGFLIKQLKKYNCKKVFESSLGIGIDAVYLSKNKFEVIGNDIDNYAIQKAKEYMKKRGVDIKITNYDWKELTKDIEKDSFDSILCLGNSLTYLFKKEDQLKVLKSFYEVLRKKGILIIDERNYQYILDNKEEILKGNFKYSKKYVFCGDTVNASPVQISQNKIKMQYIDNKNKKKVYLDLYPFKKDEMFNLLKETGFKIIKQFSDYKEGYNKDADFYQYVCVK